MMEFLAAGAIFGGCFFVTWVIYAIVTAVWEHKELKKRMEHPLFYGWIAELNNMTSLEVQYHNAEISPLVREIDKMIAEMPYLTAEKQEQMAGVLEEYKDVLAERNYELRQLEFESAKLRNRIREYNKEHKLESCWDE